MQDGCFVMQGSIRNGDVYIPKDSHEKNMCLAGDGLEFVDAGVCG